MPNREKVIELFSSCISKGGWNNCTNCEHGKAQAVLTCKPLAEDVLKLLTEQDAKPLRCKECSYHRNDGWCNEHGREVKESDYCSFGAWEGR